MFNERCKRKQAQKQPPSAMAQPAPVLPKPMSAAEFLGAASGNWKVGAHRPKPIPRPSRRLRVSGLGGLFVQAVEDGTHTQKAGGEELVRDGRGASAANSANVMGFLVSAFAGVFGLLARPMFPFVDV